MKTIRNYDPEVLGRRLKQARLDSQITQETVAREIGVARTTIVAIEKGQRRLRDDEFTRLCAFYNVAVTSILRPSQKQKDIIYKFRRDSKIQAGNPEAQKAVELLLCLASASEELESMMGRTRQKQQLPVFIVNDRDIKTQAEDAAATIRQAVGIGLLPIRDIFTLLEFNLGFSVYVRKVHSSISGIYLYDDQIGHCMLLNSNHPTGRLHFSALHELWHAVSLKSEPTYHVFFEECMECSREEVFANFFASSFLMPAPYIRKVFDEYRSQGIFSPRHLIIMAQNLNVSSEAMCRRLEELGLLKQGTYDSMKERGFSPSNSDIQIAHPQSHTTHLVPERTRLFMADAYADGLLSEGQLAKKFVLDRVDVRKLLDSMQVQKPERQTT